MAVLTWAGSGVTSGSTDVGGVRRDKWQHEELLVSAVSNTVCVATSELRLLMG